MGDHQRTDRPDPYRTPGPDPDPREERAPGKPDASDVVTGDIGEARLRTPDPAEPHGADLDKLPDPDDVGPER
jgi:hypothetical protein